MRIVHRGGDGGVGQEGNNPIHCPGVGEGGQKEEATQPKTETREPEAVGV